MSNKAYIKEIFTSLQGEGLYIGEKQQFIRFCGCNLKCNYCDTDFTQDKDSLYLNPEELAEKLDGSTISLTGGEPLLCVDFLEEFLPKVRHGVYLETNGTLYNELARVANYISVCAMDIKLESTCGNPIALVENELFIRTAIEHKSEIFVKIVFDLNITDEEIEKTGKLVEKYNLILVLQPKTPMEKDFTKYEVIMNKYLAYAKEVRLIPQVHKLINVR